MVVREGVVAERAVRADRMFQALADPTRRDILAVVLRTEQSVSALAERYPMSFAAVQKHVAVLERAELIHKRRHGREQLVSGDMDALRQVNQLLQAYEAIWRSRIDRMQDILAAGEAIDEQGGSAPGRPAPHREGKNPA